MRHGCPMGRWPTDWFGVIMGDSVSYEEYLDQYGSLTYSVVGVSMLPLLRQKKDLFIARKKDERRCSVGDVVLFRRPPDKYVLHRVVAVLPDGYETLGDNCVSRERGVKEEDILGVMTGFVRNGRQHSVDEPWYRAYTFVWMHTTRARVLVKKARSVLVRRIRSFIR